MKTSTNTVTVTFQTLMYYMERLAINQQQLLFHANSALHGGAYMKVRIDTAFGYDEMVREVRDGLGNAFFTTDITEDAVHDYVTDTYTYLVETEGLYTSDSFRISIREIEQKPFIDCLSKDEVGDVHYTPRAYEYIPSEEIIEKLEQFVESAYIR